MVLSRDAAAIESARRKRAEIEANRASIPFSSSGSTYSDRMRERKRKALEVESKEQDENQRRFEADSIRNREKQSEEAKKKREKMLSKRPFRSDLYKPGEVKYARLKSIRPDSKQGLHKSIPQKIKRLEKAFSNVANDPFKSNKLESGWKHGFGSGALNIKTPDMKVHSRFSNSNFFVKGHSVDSVLPKYDSVFSGFGGSGLSSGYKHKRRKRRMYNSKYRYKNYHKGKKYRKKRR